MSIETFWMSLKKNLHAKLNGEFVFVFHEGRCGSTILGDLLDQHPKIKWMAEPYWSILNSWRMKWLVHRGEEKDILFSKDLLNTYAKMKKGELNILPEGEDVFSALETWRKASTEKFLGVEIQFFELDLFNIRFKDYIQNVKEKGTPHFIVLERKNQLRTATSFLIAAKNLQFHITSDKKAQVTKIKINPSSMFLKDKEITLIEHLQETKRIYSHIKKVLLPEKHLYLSYEEDIASDPLVAYKKVCRFLNIQSLEEEAFIRYNKTNPFLLKDIIENFDEIVEELKETEFEWMLYE